MKSNREVKNLSFIGSYYIFFSFVCCDSRGAYSNGGIGKVLVL